MAISRAPGGTGDIRQYQTAQYDSATAYTGPTGSPSAQLKLRTANVNTLLSQRNSYPKGTVITLPGGGKFRKATSYSTSTVELELRGAYECNHTTRNPYRVTNLKAYDSGREASWLLDSGYGLCSASIPTDARNEAVTKALNKIADQKVNLGENLATFSQTARLFSSKAKILAAALHAAKDRKSWQKYLRKSARQLSRRGSVETAAQEYLAYVYGLRPLMQDVFNSAETLKSLSQKTLLVNGVGRAVRTYHANQQEMSTLSAYALKGRNSGFGHQRVKCSLWARPDPNFQGLRALNQLGLSNPLGLAWDLVPWSFCVDWLLPVGPVLYALSARMGLIFVDGSISCRASDEVEYEYRVNYADHLHARSRYDEHQTGQCIVTRKYEGYNRQVIAKWPLPGFWIDADPLRGDRPFKAIALLITSLKR